MIASEIFIVRAYILTALLHAIPVSFGVIRIQSVETRLYLAFSKKGRLYGEVKHRKEI